MSLKIDRSRNQNIDMSDDSDDDYLSNYSKNIGSLDLGEGISFLKGGLGGDDDSDDSNDHISDKEEKDDVNREKCEDFNNPKYPNRFCYTDMNEKGLRRGKKTSVDPSGKKGIYQNEDCHFFIHELGDNIDVFLFGVFDGHGGRSCSNSLSTLFYTIFLRYWKIEIENNNGKLPTEISYIWLQ
jgi:hypothetical protein